MGDNGTILAWNGTTWSPESSGSPQMIWSVACPTTALCKAVGNGAYFPPDPGQPIKTILSWDGTSWSLESAAGTTPFLAGVACPTTTFCKAVGNLVTAEPILTWNGTTWSLESAGGGVISEALWGVACPTTMPTITLCQAVGSHGTILSWNGTSWSQSSGPTHVFLREVACPTATLCKAVGDNGTILSWNGTSWSRDGSGRGGGRAGGGPSML